MRFKRNYFNGIKNLMDGFISRFKPLTVHTEAIMVDSVWEKIKEKIEKKEVLKWYIMTPLNYDFYKSSFNIKMTKEKVNELMKKRYNWMIKHGQKLELHIHLSLIMNNITYQEQEKIFNDSINWIKKELKINVTEFVPGWWAYNDDTLKILKKLNLKMIYPKNYDYTHDYHWVL